MKSSPLEALKRAADDAKHPERFEQQLALARKAKAQAASDRKEKDWYKRIASELVPAKAEAIRHREENARLKRDMDILAPIAKAKVVAVVKTAEAKTETMRIMQLEFLKTLKTKRDVIVWQHRMEGMTVREIAEAIGMSIGTAHRDIKRLAAQFDRRLKHPKIKTKVVPIIDRKDRDDRTQASSFDRDVESNPDEE